MQKVQAVSTRAPKPHRLGRYKRRRYRNCRKNAAKNASLSRPTVVSLVGQLATLRLGSTEKLDDYFVRSQEPMSRINDAGELISETFFKALVINGFPAQYAHFVQELRTRLRNFEDAKMGDKLCYALVWVGDITICCKSKGCNKNLREVFNHRFK